MNNRCESCKHWGSVDRGAYRDELLGYGDQKRCGRIVDASDIGDDELSNEPAYTKDGEDYYSAIFTRPNFGCVLWEAKQ